jgi:hypothetical protein
LHDAWIEGGCDRPEVRRGPLVSGQCGIANEIRTLRREAGIPERICLRDTDDPVRLFRTALAD